LQQFRASDGTAIAYEDVGEGRTLVLLHGLMAHSGFFARQRELSADFRLVSIDLRGHGASKTDGKAASVADLAVDVADLAAALGLDDAIGIGWSLGASVLWELLSGPAAERFAGAVIVDMTPRVLNDGDWTLGLPQDACDARTQAIRSDFTAFARNAGQAIFAQPVRPELRQLAEWAGAEFARNDPAAIDSIWSSLVEADYRSVLPTIYQPTLIIRGAQSQLYGSGTAEHLASALPDARSVRFDHSGHAPQLEQPDLFNRTIREFAAGLPQTREQQATAF
jgi:pimeloyl-[acyl-carrier protein] methyl ester esterase